jgi:hypothetical protein
MVVSTEERGLRSITRRLSIVRVPEILCVYTLLCERIGLQLIVECLEHNRSCPGRLYILTLAMFSSFRGHDIP